MDIADWRKRIDEIDHQLVELVNERARAALEIGRLKRQGRLPVHEPDRERRIYENLRTLNRGPLQDSELVRIYESLIDVMRNLQMEDRDRAASLGHRKD